MGSSLSRRRQTRTSWFWVWGFGFWVLGFGFWVLGFGASRAGLFKVLKTQSRALDSISLGGGALVSPFKPNKAALVIPRLLLG